jgi:hypothetical protein
LLLTIFCAREVTSPLVPARLYFGHSKPRFEHGGRNASPSASRRIEASSTVALCFARRSGAPEKANYDVQLHIGESISPRVVLFLKMLASDPPSTWWAARRLRRAANLTKPRSKSAAVDLDPAFSFRLTGAAIVTSISSAAAASATGRAGFEDARQSRRK